MNKAIKFLQISFITKHEKEKAMAPHSSTLVWRTLWMEESGGLQPIGSLRVGTTERLHFHFSLSCIGEGNGNPLQCSCLENTGDGEAWWASVCGVTQSRTWLKQLSKTWELMNEWLNISVTVKNTCPMLSKLTYDFIFLSYLIGLAHPSPFLTISHFRDLTQCFLFAQDVAPTTHNLFFALP